LKKRGRWLGNYLLWKTEKMSKSETHKLKAYLFPKKLFLPAVMLLSGMLSRLQVSWIAAWAYLEHWERRIAFVVCENLRRARSDEPDAKFIAMTNLTTFWFYVSPFRLINRRNSLTIRFIILLPIMGGRDRQTLN